MARMLDLEVIDNPAAAVVDFDPLRARLLAGLAEPASASALAERFALPRQKVSYHQRILEEHGLVAEVGQRRWGGLTSPSGSRHATAAAYVVSPGAPREAAGDPDRITDRLSARYLIALAARAVREVAGLARRADQAGRRLPTLALDTEIRFWPAAERAAFTSDLAAAVTTLVSALPRRRRPRRALPLPGGGGPSRARRSPTRTPRRHHEQWSRRHPGGPGPSTWTSRSPAPRSRSGRRSPAAPGSPPGSSRPRSTAVGGTVELDFGPGYGTQTAQITAWSRRAGSRPRRPAGALPSPPSGWSRPATAEPASSG